MCSVLSFSQSFLFLSFLVFFFHIFSHSQLLYCARPVILYGSKDKKSSQFCKLSMNLDTSSTGLIRYGEERKKRTEEKKEKGEERKALKRIFLQFFFLFLVLFLSRSFCPQGVIKVFLESYSSFLTRVCLVYLYSNQTFNQSY